MDGFRITLQWIASFEKRAENAFQVSKEDQQRNEAWVSENLGEVVSKYFNLEKKRDKVDENNDEKKQCSKG